VQQAPPGSRAVADGEPRFVLLEAIREFGLEQLEATDEAEPIRRRHAAYYLALAEAAEPKLRRADQGHWLHRLERGRGQFRAALSWCGAEGAGAEIELRLAAALGYFWLVHRHLGEGRRALDHALARLPAEWGDGGPAAPPAAGQPARVSPRDAAARARLGK